MRGASCYCACTAEEAGLEFSTIIVFKPKQGDTFILLQNHRVAETAIQVFGSEFLVDLKCHLQIWIIQN